MMEMLGFALIKIAYFKYIYAYSILYDHNNMFPVLITYISTRQKKKVF